jgi:hypothetical protein
MWKAEATFDVPKKYRFQGNLSAQVEAVAGLHPPFPFRRRGATPMQ